MDYGTALWIASALLPMEDLEENWEASGVWPDLEALPAIRGLRKDGPSEQPRMDGQTD